ncbi:MAG TPA: glycosyltransferase family 2 protein [Gemmatimonadota bacterium]|nr:glycosyltransferase family 2 protein [Gemmatimonadota bacterium]
MEAPDLSVVIPLVDEAPNLASLHAELVPVLESLGTRWEILYVDDGSRDHGPHILAEIVRLEPRVRLVRLARNYGQSTALIAGAESARGRWMATLDADGQNDPADLVGLWREIAGGRADAVTGVRVARADSRIRRFSSGVANRVRDRLTGDPVTDVGCSLRIFPRASLLAAPRFEGMHRFLPTLLRMTGCTVVERAVHHRPRRGGRSKYGIGNRLWRGLADLLVVRRLLRRRIEYAVLPSEPNPATDPIHGKESADDR